MPGIHQRYVDSKSIINPLKDFDVGSSKDSERILKDLAQLDSSKKIYNDWITKGITEQVRKYSFETEGIKIEFLRATVDKPQHPDISMGIKPLYPNYSRMNRYPYEGKLRVVIRITTKGEVPHVETSEIHMGNIPIMIGSVKCNLHNLTPEEKVAHGENFEDPGGYFIIATERSVIVQEKQRMSFPLIAVEKGASKCSYTTSIGIKSYLINLKVDKRLSINASWEVMDMKKQDFPVIGIFKILSGDMDSNRLIDDYVLPFVPDKMKSRCKSFLRISKILGPTMYRHDGTGDEMKAMAETLLRIENRDSSSVGIEEVEFIRRQTAETMFRSLPYSGGVIDESNPEIKNKLLQLGSMLAKYTMYLSGFIPEDFRDSWGLKRFDTPGISMALLFATIFNKTIKDIKNTIETNETVSHQRIFGDIQSKRAAFDKIVHKSFNGVTWGSSSSKSSANITEQTKMDTPIQIFSQNSKSNTPTNARTKNPALRNVQSSQFTHTCTAETPEGGKVGLIKHKAITSYYSTHQPSDEAIKLVKSNCLKVKEIKAVEYNPDDYEELLIAKIMYFDGSSLRRFVGPGELILEDTSKIPEEIVELVLSQLSFEVSNYTPEIVMAEDGAKLGSIELFWVTVNGDVMTSSDNSLCYVDSSFKDKFIDLRRQGIIPKFAEIYQNDSMKSFEIATDASRPCACYFVVNGKTNELVIEEKDMWKEDINVLLRSGCMEFVSAREFENADVVIAQSVSHFRKHRDVGYSHCLIDPLQMFSLVTSLNPWSNHQPSPRSTYQASMIKQALNVYSTNWHLFLKNFKRLKYPDRPLCESITASVVDMDIHPAGQTAIVAFMAHPSNQEDAVVVTDTFINSGKFTYIRYSTVTVAQEKSTEVEEKLAKPIPKSNEDPERYAAIGEDGLPKLDHYIREGDCVVGMTQLIKAEGVETPANHFTGIGEYGYVDRVFKTEEKSNVIINVRLRSENKYIAGDKVALRYSQKGTIARVIKAEDMPMITSGPNKGVIPEVLFNPIGFPSRRTNGLTIEALKSKAALYSGQRQNCTAFRDPKEAIQRARKVLQDNGMDPDGYEEISIPVLGEDGERRYIKLENPIFCAPAFYQILKHQVLDKIQMRATGRVKPLTHQPVRGRTKRGGLRKGEMEKDADGAHGAASCLLDRMMHSSDRFEIVVCHSCGYLVNAPDEMINKCSCKRSDPGILVIPYIFKLFFQMIQTMGIDFRINTRKISQSQ